MPLLFRQDAHDGQNECVRYPVDHVNPVKNCPHQNAGAVQANRLWPPRVFTCLEATAKLVATFLVETFRSAGYGPRPITAKTKQLRQQSLTTVRLEWERFWERFWELRRVLPGQSYGRRSVVDLEYRNDLGEIDE